LRDNSKPRFAIQQTAVKDRLILELEADKSTYLDELNVKKQFVASISQRSEELGH
jgi:hypothetical protein